MKKKLCSLLVTIAAYGFCVVLFGLSFEAIIAIHHEWIAVDYWLMWFSVFAFFGGLINGIFGTVMGMTFVDGLCGSDR